MVHEETEGEARTAFYIADPDLTRLHPIRSAGDMPQSYLKQVEGFVIGRDSLAWGLATATGQSVLTRDVFDEPLWQPWVHLAGESTDRGDDPGRIRGYRTGAMRDPGRISENSFPPKLGE